MCHILDSTYKWYHIVFVFLFVTPLSIRISCCIHVAANGIILFYGWILFHCVCVPHLFNSFICWWTFRLSPYLGSCKWCCGEHSGLHVSYRIVVVSGCAYVCVCVYLHIPRSGIARAHGYSIFTFLRNFHTVFRSDLYQSTFPAM